MEKQDLIITDEDDFDFNIQSTGFYNFNLRLIDGRMIEFEIFDIGTNKTKKFSYLEEDFLRFFRAMKIIKNKMEKLREDSKWERN